MWSHPLAGWDPRTRLLSWIPACAGMTKLLKIISTQYYMIYYSDDDKWGGLNPIMASSHFGARV